MSTNIINNKKINAYINVQYFFYASFFSMFVSLFYNPLDASRIGITKFERYLGIGVAKGVDVEKRINNFNLWFIISILLFIVFLFAFSYLFSKIYLDKQIVKFLNRFAVLANFVLAIRMVSLYRDYQEYDSCYSYLLFFVCFIFVALLVYAVLFNKNIELKIIKKVLLFNICFSYVVSILLFDEWNHGINMLKVLILAYVIILILHRMISSITPKYNLFLFINKIADDFILIGFALAGFYELYLLKTRVLEYYFYKEKQSCMLIMFIALVSFAIESIKKKNKRQLYSFEKLYIRKKESLIKVYDGDLFDFLGDLIVLTGCILCWKFMSGEYSIFNDYYFWGIICATIFFFLSYYILDLKPAILFNDYIKVPICFFSLGYGVSLCWNSGMEIGKKHLICYSVLLLLFLIFIKWSGRKREIKQIQGIFSGLVLAFSTIPILSSIYIELINILNQYSIFVANPAMYYRWLLVCVLLIGIVLSILYSKRGIGVKNWESIVYPLLILGFSALSIQIPLQKSYHVDIFESANYGILISDFLNFGKIPLVEHYGGHMMTGVWEGILYGVLNNDYIGASVSPYVELINVFTALLFYFLISKFWNDNIAFWVTLFFPYHIIWYYFGLGVLVCVSLFFYLNNKTYKNAFLLWFALIWCALYRLDLGAAFGISLVLAIFIYVLVFKELKSLVQLGISLIVWFFVGIALWSVLCFANDINPVVRLYEFLMISLSNYNWAYVSVGNSVDSLFNWVYVAVPFVILYSIVYLVLTLKSRSGLEKNKWMVLLVLGIAYLANFSRGLVRHSMVEEALHVILWSAYIFIALFVSVYSSNKRLILPSLLLCISIEIFLGGDAYLMRNIADDATNTTNSIVQTWYEEYIYDEKSNSHKTYWEDISDKEQVVNRVLVDDKINEEIEACKVISNTLLNDNETFLDFSNITFVYAMINRECPVYVSQSPLQLSGEYTQEQYMEQIKDVPIIILPYKENIDAINVSLDGINNTYRYYLVSEYLYYNYVPLCGYDDLYAIWCKKDKYNEYVELLQNIGDARFELIYYDYDNFNLEDNNLQNKYYLRLMHEHYLQLLPWLWANCDTKQAVNNEVVDECVEAGEYYLLNLEQYSQQGNYMLLELNSGCSANAKLVVGKMSDGCFEEKYCYEFKLVEGKNKYLIRVSTDYYWYTKEMNAIKVESDDKIVDNFNVERVAILYGD